MPQPAVTSANLWILTEERPKTEVLTMLFDYFARGQSIGYIATDLRIIPLLDSGHRFSFTYEVVGFNCARVAHVYLKTVSGNSSFVDHLLYWQADEPTPKQVPLYAIEETKTDDKESRNTGVYQRSAKFVFADFYYPSARKAMLYALQVKQKEQPTDTNIFGTRLLMTLGVDILGKKLDPTVFRPFTSVDELIECKAAMHRPNRTNVPILITKQDGEIRISGRLVKSGMLAHDPNIGALTAISAALRKLGWQGRIILTRHGLTQEAVTPRNKFVRTANRLRTELDGLTLPSTALPGQYWHYERKGEKLATIFIHLAVENFTEGYSVFDNHAGCEKSYFTTPAGDRIPLAKYADRKLYKRGDKSQIVYIPDIVLIDVAESETITVEGKTYDRREQGISELDNYGSFDRLYLDKYYPAFHNVRTVVLYGGTERETVEIQVGFLLNAEGRLVLGIRAPKLFRRAVGNLLDYWK